MPQLLSSTPGGLTGVTLEHNAFWRLQLGALVVEQVPALSLCLRYPPGTAGMMFLGGAQQLPPEVNQVGLLRVPVRMASDLASVQRIATVALEGGSLERDRARLTEAFEMFKNKPRAPSGAAFEEGCREAIQLIDIYWAVTDWLLEGAKQEQRQQVILGDQPPQVLIMRP